MGEPAKQASFTVEDYLEGEKTAEVRHEYVDGEVFAMVGTTKAHNSVALNLALLLREHLAGKPCRVYMSDVKVHIKTKTTERFYYPDLHVECEPLTGDSYYSERPRLIVEVLSASTERGDRSDKFYAYRKLPSRNAQTACRSGFSRDRRPSQSRSRLKPLLQSLVQTGAMKSAKSGWLNP